MRKSKNWNEIENVRDEIFNNAVKLFAKKGYHATTIRDVVEKAGVTQPMVYYYFGNKDQLFKTCVRELYSGFSKQYDAIDKNLSLKEFLREYLRLGDEIFVEQPEKLLLMIHLLHSPDEYPKLPEIVEIISKPITIIAEAVKRAKSRGEISENIDEYVFAVSLFGSMVMTASVLYNLSNYGHPEFIAIEKYKYMVVDLLLFGVFGKK